VAEHYPNLTFRTDPAGDRMFLEGLFVLKTDCGVSTPISIRVEFPTSYPDAEPTAYDAAKHFRRSVDRHILSDGQFCLWLPPCSLWEKDDPVRLLRFLDEVAVFLERQLVYDATGAQSWPGPQYKHGADGYTEFMLGILDGNEGHLSSLFPAILGKTHPSRNEPCPCGSQQKYKRCHAERVEAIIRRVGRNRISFLYLNPLATGRASAKT
jgi:hypothetical protein